MQVIVDNTMPHAGTGNRGEVRLKANIPFDEWRVVHELAHAWDGNHGWQLSRDLERATGGHTARKGSKEWQRLEAFCAANDPYHELPGCNEAGYVYGDVPPKTSSEKFNRLEDFAESVAAYLYPEQAREVVQDQLEGYQKTFRQQKRQDLFELYESHLGYNDFRATVRGKYIARLLEKVKTK